MSNIILHYFAVADCTWMDWSEWSSCSTTCDDGTQTRRRAKDRVEVGGGTCNGQPMEKQACNLESCGKLIFETDITKCNMLLCLINMKSLKALIIC